MKVVGSKRSTFAGALLAAGADTQTKDKNGKTAFDHGSIAICGALSDLSVLARIHAAAFTSRFARALQDNILLAKSAQREARRQGTRNPAPLRNLPRLFPSL